MPTYSYTCENGHEYTEFRSIDDNDRATKCPTCDKPLTRTYGVGSVTFKGNGFYSNDKGQR